MTTVLPFLIPPPGKRPATAPGTPTSLVSAVATGRLAAAASCREVNDILTPANVVEHMFGHHGGGLHSSAMIWWQAAAWVPAAVWLFLLLGRGFFWRTNFRLPQFPAPANWPPVSVVVPARDEAAMLASTMPRLLAQDYRGPAEVILVDDCSTDGTARAALVCAELPGSRLPLRVVEGVPRPAGWAGKTWALRQGVSAAAAGQLGAELLLFTDADIDHPPESLSRLVAAAEATKRDLVSLMARLRVVTGWERLVVPAFVYFFATLYPFRRVSRDRSRIAAAAGGCVLVRRGALEEAGGIESISGAVIDDVSLAKAVKRAGGSVWLGFADEVASVRPYSHLSDLWDMVARSAYTQLRHSPVALAGTVAGLAVVYLGPFTALLGGAIGGDTAVVAAGAVAWAVMTATYLPMVRYYGLHPLMALTLPLAAVLYLGMTIDSALRHRRGTGAAWKGRTYAGDVSG
jgi:hopene-associated glycosyltransferase HpnB